MILPFLCYFYIFILFKPMWLQGRDSSLGLQLVATWVCRKTLASFAKSHHRLQVHAKSYIEDIAYF